MRGIVTFAAIAALGALLLFGFARRGAEPRAPAAATGERDRPVVAKPGAPAHPHPRAASTIRTAAYHSLYPLPYDIEYPGPNAKRACVARYVQEYRAERHGGRAADALLVGAGMSA